MIMAEDLLDILDALHEENWLMWESEPSLDWVGVDGFLNLYKMAELINRKLEENSA